MRDSITVNRVDELHPKIVQMVKDGIAEAEDKLGPYAAIRIVQGLRTFAYQAGLYELGRTKKNPNGSSPRHPYGNVVTNAKAGQSIHNYGLAFDFAIMYDLDKNGSFETLSWNLKTDENKDGLADWAEVVNIFKAKGFTWGGDFKSITDSPHLEYSRGHDYKYFLQLYTDKKFIPGTTFVAI